MKYFQKYRIQFVIIGLLILTVCSSCACISLIGAGGSGNSGYGYGGSNYTSGYDSNYDPYYSGDIHRGSGGTYGSDGECFYVAVEGGSVLSCP